MNGFRRRKHEATATMFTPRLPPQASASPASTKSHPSSLSVWFSPLPAPTKKPRIQAGLFENSIERFDLRRSPGAIALHSSAYFANRNFEACDFARAAALRCTTPDFTALSIADV